MYYTTNGAMTPQAQQEGTNQATESAPKQPAPGTGDNIVRGKINDPNSPEERLWRLEQLEKEYHEKNKQMEGRLKEVEPKPVIERTVDGYVLNIPDYVGAAVGGILGAVGGGLNPAVVGAGALAGSMLEKNPIPLHPQQRDDPQPTW